MKSTFAGLRLAAWLAVAWLPAALSGQARAGEISGWVRARTDSSPIAGAMVTVQASDFRTFTAGDGGFALQMAAGAGYVVVGAAKGFYNAGVVTASPAEGLTILLDRVPQDDDPSYELLAPETCSFCHATQYQQWVGSPMADAGLNTWVDDNYSGLGTPGGDGGFVYLRDSIFTEANPASECASCHQPELWIKEKFAPLAEPSPAPSAEVLHGISCEVCHKIADVDVSKINYPGIFPGAVTFTRPAGPQHHPVEYGVLGDVSYTHPLFMRASYQPQLMAEVCGVCHQDAADPAGDHSFAGVISEPTYLEWAASPYGDPNSPMYKSCVDCHMGPAGTNQVCDILFPPLIRDPQTIKSHDIRGTTPEFLENAVELAMQVNRVGPEFAVQIDLTNSLTGHHVPTGVTVRNMILLVEAYRDDDARLTFTGAQTVHELGGVGDPSQGYYAGLPGKFYAVVNHDAAGTGPTFYTEATGIHFDNRLAALETDGTAYSFAVPGGGGNVRLQARLIYRRAFRAIVDAKGWTEDSHGAPLADVLPPHFGHLMESAAVELMLLAGDADGDDDVDLADYVPLVQCLDDANEGALPVHCQVIDVDRNGEINLNDFAGWQNQFGVD